MIVKTSRFGDINVDKSDFITFTEGIMGLEATKKYFIVDPEDATLIMWLQAVDNPTLAFPILEPNFFVPDYQVTLLPQEMQDLQLQDMSHSLIYSILTIPQDISKISANVKAPIVINSANKMARQIIMQSTKLAIKLEIYKELKRFLANMSGHHPRAGHASNVKFLRPKATPPSSTPSTSSH